MPFSEGLAERVRKVLHSRNGIVEKRMFGGIAFMLNGKMCCGVLKDDLVVRVDPTNQDAMLKERGARPMDFTGRPMKGYLYINPGGCDTAALLRKWLDRAIRFTESLSAPSQRSKRRSNRSKRSA
ncbi:MAG: TfoX/Sxy family protein [Nitrospirae bacterium]|nr:TfoX/Sxy family protein [Nitrospirota bacterium]